MKQRFLARMRTVLDEIEQNAPTDLALFEYVDLLTARTPRPTRTLFAAAAEGDLLTTRALLLRHNADIDAFHVGGMTPMYIAAAHGHTELVGVLADEGGADVNLGTPTDSTLQLVEAWKDDPPPEWIRGLKRGAAFPLYIAARNGKVDTVRALLQRGAKVDQRTDYPFKETALWGASRDGRTEVIKLLLDHGADVNEANVDGQNALHAASVGGHAEAVAFLLSAGAVADVCGGESCAPLHAAAVGGRSHSHSEIITLLLDTGGVDINQVTGEAHDYPGSTALMLAAELGHVEAIDILLGRGADVSASDDAGATALSFASDNGHVEAITLLLGRGADANTSDGEGFTPVWGAAGGGHVEAMKALLDYTGGGADVNKVNNTGETPLYAASQGGHVAAMKLLLDRGADTSKADTSGKTPVYIASQNGNADAVHVLLKAGADARVAANNGRTALHCAARGGYLDVVRVLAETWPTNPLAWRMFLMGGGAASELQDYLAPPANRTTRNHLPRLYSKPDMMKEIYKYLYKPRYADLNQLDDVGRTALQLTEAMPTSSGQEVVTLLRALSLG